MPVFQLGQGAGGRWFRLTSDGASIGCFRSKGIQGLGSFKGAKIVLNFAWRTLRDVIYHATGAKDVFLTTSAKGEWGINSL